jgi:DNA-binding NarL/FixJ family response regulator
MPAENKIRLLVADDQEMVRCGVKALVATTEIEVVAEATTAQAAVELALESNVDVVLLDVRLTEGDGLTALGRIKLDKPDVPVLLFSAFDNPASIARAVALGANGFLLKGCQRGEFLDAVRKVANGGNAWSKEGLRSASKSLKAPRAAGSVEAYLSDSEGEVLRHIAYGRTNKQIAEVMQCNDMTVREHVQHVLRKIGVADRTQAALWAVRNDLI